MVPVMHGAVETQSATSGFAGWFTGRPLWYLTATAIAVNALLFGISPVPFLRYGVRAMDDPFNPQNVAGLHNVEPGSPAMWICADWIGVDSVTGFAYLNLAVLVGSLLACAYLVARWVSDFAGRLFVVAWFASPLANVNLTWLGKPDHLTMLAAVLLGVGPPGACFVGGMLLGFNHFEQGVFILAGTLIVRLAFRSDSRRWLAHALVGFAVGRLVWMIYANAVNYDAGGRLSWVTDQGIGDFVRVWRGNLPTLIFGAFGVLWLPIVVMWRTVGGGRQRAAMAVALVVATVPTLLALDTTRVYTLLTLPLLLGCVVWTARNIERETLLRWLPWFLVAAVFVPRVMLWGAGTPYVSSWERLL
jgi:hypothetical protein